MLQSHTRKREVVLGFDAHHAMGPVRNPSDDHLLGLSYRATL